MQEKDFTEASVISPYQEMLAYETLWAIENTEESIKEKTLKDWFKKYTPSEALSQLKTTVSHQPSLLAPNKSYEELEQKINKSVEGLLQDQSNPFSIMTNRSFQYPENLITHYPIGLFYYKGDLGMLETRCISVVGTRKASSKGVENTRKLVKELSDKKFTIVSGLATGIDSIAHQSAIENKGRTIGVIGTPINQCYPKENQTLQNQIAKDFLLISQVPFYKYKHEPFDHHKFHFPRRNMTMASISEATVIVEASDTSGSLIQARECLKQNKKLFILDLCFHNSKITWPMDYEKKGAIRITNTSDILKHINEQKKMA